MKHTKISKILLALFAVVLCYGPVGLAEPVGTAFTYQGRLLDANSAADGLYDFQFKLFDGEADGNQLGLDVNTLEVDVIDGYFTVELDFGGVFDGNNHWLEIGVRLGIQSDPNVYTALSPRQEITPTPYALQTRGLFVDNAGNVGIGTTSPAEKLEVNGTIKTATICETPIWAPKGILLTGKYESVAMSADGTKQTAVVYGGQIYVSTDSGNTWTAKESSRNWYSVAMSADGTKQTAVVMSGQIYISTDSGNTWTPKEPNRNWYSVAMSADGTKQTAVVYNNGQIYVSTDSGNTWTPKESNRWWISVAMSADGTKQTAVVDNGQIYVSMDSGDTWAAKESNRNWYSVAMSADGTKQTAVDNYGSGTGGRIYISTDSGNTWTAKESNRNWHSVAMSADGTKQTAVVWGGQIYISTDSGDTWFAKESNRQWTSVAMSADGTKQTAVVWGGKIYVYNESYIVVGIGTTNPSNKLDVVGDASVSGNVGIGTTTPARNLHINDVMRLQPRATAPSSPAEGDIYMNSTERKLMVFDGLVWRACW